MKNQNFNTQHLKSIDSSTDYLQRQTTSLSGGNTL